MVFTNIMLKGSINNTNKLKFKNKFSSEDGFTLVEVLIAIVIISLVTALLLQGTLIAVNTLKMNKAKTGAIAVANEKIELIRAMNYTDVDLTSQNPNWAAETPGILEDGYTVTVDVSWVNGNTDSYKQLEVSIIQDPMNVPVEVVTQLYPGAVIESIGDYPPAENLYIEYDTGSGGNREIKLVWAAPDTEKTIDKYKVYSDNIYIGDALTELYIDYPGSSSVYTFYIIVLYGDGTESLKSNEITTI